MAGLTDSSDDAFYTGSRLIESTIFHCYVLLALLITHFTMVGYTDSPDHTLISTLVGAVLPDHTFYTGR